MDDRGHSVGRMTLPAELDGGLAYAPFPPDTEIIGPPYNITDISLIACKLDLEDLDILIDPQTKLPIDNPTTMVPRRTDTELTAHMPLNLTYPQGRFQTNGDIIGPQVHFQSL